eukprot:1083082-Rhodomonas_salina.1
MKGVQTASTAIFGIAYDNQPRDQNGDIELRVIMSDSATDHRLKEKLQTDYPNLQPIDVASLQYTTQMWDAINEREKKLLKSYKIK